MDNAVFTAAISGAVALVTAAMSVALTYFLTKKMKLDLYRAYLLALSRVIKTNKTSDDQIRYADALNSLTLVAPPAVLKALYAFVDAVSHAAGKPNVDLDDRLDELLIALPGNIHPGSLKRGERPGFRFMAAPQPNPDPVTNSSIGS
jgi:hypothetical protein